MNLGDYYTQSGLDVLIPIDQAIDSFETGLSHFSRIPILGIGSGALKVTFGIVQTVAGIAFAILLFFICCDPCLTEYYNHSWSHAGHGMANILAGSLEAIPGIGYLLHYWSECRKESLENSTQTGVVNRDYKLYNYSLLNDSVIKKK